MALKTHGTMAVDWEQRIDFDRLRKERLARAKALLAKSEMGALLCFDMNNVRYITATHIGTWAQDKISRFTLLPQNDEPILWDFGSAAKHHQLNCPWLGERSRAGNLAAARRDVSGNGARRRCRAQDQDRARNARSAQAAAGNRRRRAADPVRAAEAKGSRSSTASSSCRMPASSRRRTRSRCSTRRP